MTEKLLPIFYLPTISWFSEFLDDDASIILEQFENFPKQTYRNRANIYGANGKLSLIIPLKHNGKRIIQDLEISYEENWQKLHWKSIKTAYQSTPYFEFYEDHFASLYEYPEKFLIDFNLRSIQAVLSVLKTERAYSLNKEYHRVISGEDFRQKFSAKKETEYSIPMYYQNFSDKMGFIEDLSIIDLIFSKGPESLSFIKNVEIKK